MASSKQVKQFLETIDKTKWTITKSNGGHYKVIYNKGGCVFFSSTPGDCNFHKNAKAEMKRIERNKP